MKTRLMHVISDLAVGGAQTQLALLSQGLDTTEFDVHVCSLTRAHDTIVSACVAGLPVIFDELSGSSTRHPATWWQLTRLMRRLRPDVVHIWRRDAALFATSAAAFAGIQAIVVTDRSRKEDRRLRTVPSHHLVTRMCDTWVVNHEIVRNQLLSLSIPLRKIEVIRDGVAEPDLQRAIPLTQPATRSLIEELGLPADTKLIGMSGRLLREKRIKDAIWAIDLIHCLRDDVHLVVLGDGPYRRELEIFAEQVQVPDRVHFIGRQVDVTRFLPQFSAYWLTSEAESMPLGLLEAMAQGVPIVSTKLASLSGVVVAGETGFVFDIGNRAELARATLRIIEDPAMAARLSQYGRKQVISLFPASRMVEQYSNLYRRLVASDRPHRRFRRHDAAEDRAAKAMNIAPHTPSQSPQIK